MKDLSGIRQRDANKGWSAAGITMTQAEADRRVCLAEIDSLYALNERVNTIIKELETRVYSDKEVSQRSKDIISSIVKEYWSTITNYAKDLFPIGQVHGYTCGWCEWGRPDQPRSWFEYERHVQETGHNGNAPIK
jgi:hypothetical protein